MSKFLCSFTLRGGIKLRGEMLSRDVTMVGGGGCDLGGEGGRVGEGEREGEDVQAVDPIIFNDNVHRHVSASLASPRLHWSPVPPPPPPLRRAAPSD